MHDFNAILYFAYSHYRDMAQLVDTQGVAIREIATAVDNSHERTQAGLEQVSKAAEYQPGCVIC